MTTIGLAIGQRIAISLGNGISHGQRKHSTGSETFHLLTQNNRNIIAESGELLTQETTVSAPATQTFYILTQNHRGLLTEASEKLQQEAA